MGLPHCPPKTSADCASACEDVIRRRSTLLTPNHILIHPETLRRPRSRHLLGLLHSLEMRLLEVSGCQICRLRAT